MEQLQTTSETWLQDGYQRIIKNWKARIEKLGKTKYEAYVKDKKGSRKIIFVYTGDEIFIITGAEGK